MTSKQKMFALSFWGPFFVKSKEHTAIFAEVYGHFAQISADFARIFSK